MPTPTKPPFEAPTIEILSADGYTDSDRTEIRPGYTYKVTLNSAERLTVTVEIQLTACPDGFRAEGNYPPLPQAFLNDDTMSSVNEFFLYPNGYWENAILILKGSYQEDGKDKTITVKKSFSLMAID